MRDGTAWRSLAKTNGYKGLDHWDKVTGALSNLLIACRFTEEEIKEHERRMVIQMCKIIRNIWKSRLKILFLQII